MFGHSPLACIVLLLAVLPGFAQTLDLPPRAADALAGSEIAKMLEPLSLEKREEVIFSQVEAGNIPAFLRTLVPVTVREDEKTVTYFVTPDYLALGSEKDYLLIPMTPGTAQRIANLLDCTLPTRKMVDQVWREAKLKLAPRPLPPSPEMVTVSVFAQHNELVRAEREKNIRQFPPGTLVAGTKKDLVISPLIYRDFANPNSITPVVIYGWHRTDGSPIQPLYNGHAGHYADYSHGIRLIRNPVLIDGKSSTVREILRHPETAPLLSDEGPITRPHYPLP